MHLWYLFLLVSWTSGILLNVYKRECLLCSSQMSISFYWSVDMNFQVQVLRSMPRNLCCRMYCMYIVIWFNMASFYLCCCYLSICYFLMVLFQYCFMSCLQIFFFKIIHTVYCLLDASLILFGGFLTWWK